MVRIEVKRDDWQGKSGHERITTNSYWLLYDAPADFTKVYWWLKCLLLVFYEFDVPSVIHSWPRFVAFVTLLNSLALAAIPDPHNIWDNSVLNLGPLWHLALIPYYIWYLYNIKNLKLLHLWPQHRKIFYITFDVFKGSFHVEIRILILGFELEIVLSCFQQQSFLRGTQRQFSENICSEDDFEI